MKIDLAELEAALRIDENALDEANKVQPVAFHRVAKALALKVSQRDAAEQHVKEVEASIDLQIHEVLTKRKEKFTEGEIKSRKAMSKDVKEATNQYLVLCQSVGKLTALKEAYKERSFALNRMVDLYATGYFGDITKRVNINSMKDVTAAQVRRDQSIQRVQKRKENERD